MSAAPASSLAVFAFGKLPAHGDFVARGLGAAEREAWDGWASAGLEAARRDLGDGFEACHDAAPPWRFALAPGPLGDRWQAGALTPSIDRSGRRFIVVAGARADAGTLPADGAGGRVAEAMEAEIYRVFETGGDIDALVAGAQAAVAGIVPDGPGAAAGRFWTVEPPREMGAEPPSADLLSRALATGGPHG
ncbi:MAG: type VI secretion system-associated protein TagF [Phenylobacterium sp.]